MTANSSSPSSKPDAGLKRAKPKAATPKVEAKERRTVSLHRGRLLVLQVLYETDVTAHDWRVSLAHHAESMHSSAASRAFAEHLLGGVLAERDALDAEIVRFAPAFPVAQLAVVDRNILRLAMYELRQEPDTPWKVVINEAVELAKTYGGDATPRFVNGVLGAVIESDLVTSDAEASQAVGE
jgi:N utilization substance protein B